MSEIVDFVDWDDDFRYAEERRRVRDFVRTVATERGYTHGVVQEMLIKNRYRTMIGLQLTVHLQKREWVGVQPTRYVPVRIWFTEDCTLQDRDPNPEWHPVQELVPESDNEDD